MRKSASWSVMAVLAAALGFAIGAHAPSVLGQGRPEPFSIAAVAGEKGGQDIFGAYEVVPNWPKPLSQLPGHEKWTWGAGQYVFAESPNRVFILQRGELPVVERPKTIKIAPSIEFPVFRLPIRDATVASPPGALFGPDGKTPGDDRDVGEPGVDYRWEHTIVVVNANGDIIEDWTQWDKMLRRPHAIYISPYDPQKHVWIVDDYRHAIFKFTNDGKKLVQTLGEPNVPGNDEKHFYRPTFMDWFPDGSFVVADGYTNTRVVKFDRDGKYLTSWGMRGTPPEKRPGYFNNVHGIAVDPQTRRVFVNDRNNGRIQVFDENGKYLDEWSVGPRPPADIHMFIITSDRFLWAADRGTSKLIKYSLDGRYLYSWGVWGDFPGAFWGVHGISVDQEGNVYTAAVDSGGAQKFRPRKGANPAFLLGRAVRPAWGTN
ncbi:MAG TPA: 6-bladed beta-propeller [Vicinamibacterales bacterium]|nr:6-bladed beta-propeller [Vicinamibacterales bacterium]